MLWHKLAGATAAVDVGLTFVGGTSASGTGSGGIFSVSLTGLTGGVASAPAIGDIVIGCVAIRGGTNIDLSCSGYTEVADLFGDAGSNTIQLGVYYKVLTATDTVINFNTVSNFSDTVAVIHVWRNINSTPLDATSQTATDDNGASPNPPSITTVTNNAVVIAVGAAFTDTTGISVPSGMENFFGISSGASSSWNVIGIASAVVSVAGSYDPASFGTTGTDNSAMATLALRPA